MLLCDLHCHRDIVCVSNFESFEHMVLKPIEVCSESKSGLSFIYSKDQTGNFSLGVSFPFSFVRGLVYSQLIG